MAYHNVATSPSPLDGVMDAPLVGKNIFLETAVGIPFSLTRVFILAPKLVSGRHFVNFSSNRTKIFICLFKDGKQGPN